MYVNARITAVFNPILYNYKNCVYFYCTSTSYTFSINTAQHTRSLRLNIQLSHQSLNSTETVNFLIYIFRIMMNTDVNCASNKNTTSRCMPWSKTKISEKQAVLRAINKLFRIWRQIYLSSKKEIPKFLKNREKYHIFQFSFLKKKVPPLGLHFLYDARFLERLRGLRRAEFIYKISRNR